MDGLLIFLLFGVPIICVILMFVGIIMLFSGNEDTRKTGTRLLIIGSIILGLMILIGFSLCSGGFSGGH